MAITAKSFSQLVSDQVAAVQGAASGLVDLTVGSILRSVVEANAAVILWLQGLILQLLSITRASTSAGADLDSWFADYGFTRLGAVGATGSVTFSRFTPTAAATIQVGTLVQTGDGAQQYAVVADGTNPAFDVSTNSYTIAAGVTSLAVAVQAVTTGSGGNAAAGQINTLAQALPGIDTVTNAAPLSNGADAESDAAARSRFVAYIANLSRATKAAVAYAVTSIQQGVLYSLTENQDYAGNPKIGYFYVVADDGTGAPTSDFLATVYAAVDAVRPVTSTFGVFAPVVTTANVNMTITTDPAYSHPTLVATVQAALVAYINSLTVGQSLPYSRLAQIAYSASPGVLNVTATTLNSGTSDLVVDSQHVIKAGTVVVA